LLGRRKSADTVGRNLEQVGESREGFVRLPVLNTLYAAVGNDSSESVEGDERKRAVTGTRGWESERNLEEGKLKEGASGAAANPRRADNGLSHGAKP
jgi:hypothetical protein